MSDEHTIKASLLPDGQVIRVGPRGELEPLGKWVDRARLSTMTEEEIETNAYADEDNPPLTDDELGRLRPISRAEELREAQRQRLLSSIECGFQDIEEGLGLEGTSDFWDSLDGAIDRAEREDRPTDPDVMP